MGVSWRGRDLLPSGTLDRSYSFASTVESWTITAGTLSSTGGKLRATHTSPAVAIEPVGASTFADGAIVCDVTPVTVTGSIAVCWRVADSSNFYMLVWQAGQGPQLYKVVAGAATAIGAAFTAHVDGNTWVGHTVRLMVRFVGTSIKVYVDGTLVYVLIDSAISAAGRMGLRVDNGTIDVDNVEVYVA
jgi:hypothetical protein